MRGAVMADVSERDVLDFTKGPDCLNLDELDRVAAGAGSAQSRQHTADCSYCGTELALLREFTEGASASPAEAAVVSSIERQLRTNAPWRGSQSAKRGWLPAWLSWTTAGLSAAAAMAVVLLVVLSRSPQPPVGPLDSTADVLRAGGVVEIAPLGDMTTAPTILRWQPLAGAAQYRVRLLDVAQAEVWTTAVSTAELAIPAPAQALMLPRKTLFWQIDALDAQGKTIGSSRAEQFRVVGQGQ